MNEISALIEDTINNIFTSYADSNAVSTMEAGEFPEDVWRDIFEGGWTSIALPEEDGGAGLGLAGAYIPIRLSGYHTVPLPLVEALLSTYLLNIVGLQVPVGLTTIAIVGSGNGVGTEAGELTIPRVPWARHAANLVVVCAGENSASIVLVDCNMWMVREHTNLAGEPRDEVVLLAGAIQKAREMPGISSERVLTWLALGRSAQMAGALHRTLEHTITYANERSQFGKPVGKYQAVQQQIAEQAEYVHAAQCAVDTALLHLNTPHEWECIAAAKITAGEAASKVCRIAHAVHAGIGFTHEHKLQQSTRRLWAWRDEYGNEARWAAKLGEHCLGLESGQLWPWLSEQTSK